MAEQIVDAVESYNPSVASILNKLPGKRIDAHIRKVAAAGIPEQGEQTGGYTYAYAHLSHLPLFPLYSDAQHELMVKRWNQNNPDLSRLKDFNTGPDLGLAEKATIKVMEHMSGGGGTVSALKWCARTVAYLDVTAAKVGVEQIKLIIFTRWAVPTPQGKPWFVDMLENHWPDPNSKRAKMAKVEGNAVLLKARVPNDDKVTFKLLGTEAKGLKSQKTWSKRWHVERPCEAISVLEGGMEIPMQIVARIERICSNVEGREMEKRFEKQWSVPTL